MILVDSRVGSGDLLKPLQAAGVEAELATLEFGDVCFEGKGTGGEPLQIGVELKKLNDLIGSLRSGRLTGHQLPGLRKTYDHVWLLVEGQWRSDDRGIITHYQGPARGWVTTPGKMRASELEKQLLSLELCGGVHVRHTNRRPDTVRCLATLYRWWTDVALDGHTSHLAPHNPGAIIAVSDFRQAVMAWPGVGRKASLAFEQEFGASIWRVVNAHWTEWAEVKTLDDNGKERRFGEAAAKKLHTFISGGKR